MGKKKYLIIIALVIFACLTIFTFANPFEKEDKAKIEELDEEVNKKEEKEEKEEQEEKEEKEEKEETVVIIPQYPIYNNHGVEQKPQIIIDNSYDIALKAVEDAEKSLTEELLIEAVKLVEVLKDETKKEELTERLTKVEEILELIDLVDTLVKDVKQASNKIDMDDVREDITKNNVMERISELSNSLVKELLAIKIEGIADKINDVEAPQVNIEDGSILNSDTKIIVSDDSKVVIKLNDEEIENNTVVIDGEYILVAMDESFNETKISFIVDTVEPILTIVEPEKYQLEIQSEYLEKGYSAIDEVSGDITELVTKTYEFKSFESTTFEQVQELDTFKLGTYRITYTVSDEAGNSVSGTREVETIDTTNPKLTTTYANGITYITVEDATNVEFNIYKDNELKYTYNSEEIGMVLEMQSNLLEEGKYDVKVSDKSGNESLTEVFVASDLRSILDYTDSIVLHEDIELNENENLKIVSGENKIINLNGNKIIGKSTLSSASNLIKVETGASLRLEGEGEISFTAGNPDTDWGTEGAKPYPGYANNTISNSGKLVIDGPTIINNTLRGGASYVIDNYPGADLKVLSGTITQAGGDVAIRLFANSSTVTTKVTINGGTISGYRAIWIHLPGSNPLVAKMVDLTINGGTLNSTDSVYNQAIYSYSFGDSFSKTNVTINGGIFNGDVAFGGGYKGDKENVTIDGGIFNGEVGRYLSDSGWENLK